MKVSFTGNYVYTFKDQQTMFDAIGALQKVRNDKMAPEFDVFYAGSTKMHLINGQDYKDYKKAISELKDTNIKGSGVEMCHISALQSRALQIDLSRMKFTPKIITVI